MNVLVLTSEIVPVHALRSALGSAKAAEDAEIMVVAPALHESGLRFWLSDADEAIARAQQVSRKTVENLGEAGIAAHGESGEGAPLDAIEDALRDFPADRIIVFTRPEADERYREGVEDSEIKQRFGLPVEHALLPSSPVAEGADDA